MKVEDNFVIVHTRLSVNLNALTMEKVVEKRRDMVKNMTSMLTARMKEDVAANWLSTPLEDALRQVFTTTKQGKTVRPPLTEIVSERLGAMLSVITCGAVWLKLSLAGAWPTVDGAWPTALCNRHCPLSTCRSQPEAGT